MLSVCIDRFEIRDTSRDLTVIDTPYEQVEEGQNWWKSVDLPEEQKEAVGRTNAIRLFKLPLEE
jgi:2,3-dihydroxybenzoate decarboxylase